MIEIEGFVYNRECKVVLLMHKGPMVLKYLVKKNLKKKRKLGACELKSYWKLKESPYYFTDFNINIILSYPNHFAQLLQLWLAH